MATKFEIIYRGIWEEGRTKSYTAYIHARSNRTGKNHHDKSPLALDEATLRAWGMPETLIDSMQLKVEIRCGDTIVWRRFFNKTVGGWFNMFAPHPIGYERFSGHAMSYPYWELHWKSYNYLGQEWNVYVNGVKADTKIVNPILKDGYVTLYTSNDSLLYQSNKTSVFNKMPIRAVLDTSMPNDIRVVPEVNIK